MRRVAVAGFGAGMAMAAAAAGLLGGGPFPPLATLPREPFVQMREEDPFRTQRQRNRLNKKLRAKLGRKRDTRRHSTNYPHPLPDRTEGQMLIERMTNWQRSQWGRAGYPGLPNGHVTIEKVRPYAALRRPTAIDASTATFSESP